jgi:hypothetical protein
VSSPKAIGMNTKRRATEGKGMLRTKGWLQRQYCKSGEVIIENYVSNYVRKTKILKYVRYHHDSKRTLSQTF